jgi:hypothetical protein
VVGNLRLSPDSPILPANITGQQLSKMKVGNGGPAISVVPRKEPPTTVSF